MSAATMVAPPRWDLDDLFTSLDDPRIEQVWRKCLEAADQFAADYRGQINTSDLCPETLAKALSDLESIAQEAAKPLTYANLLFSADTGNPAYGAFMQSQQEWGTALNVKLLFFDLELQAAPQVAVEKALQNPALENYRHYIRTTRSFSPHRLSEPEEIILEEMANSGVRAWERLFEEVTANHTYRVRTADGTTRETNEQEILAMLRNPNREVRQAAADAFTDGLSQMRRVLTLAFNNLLHDKSIKDRLRKHPYPEHARHLSNELEKETVDLVIRLCREHYKLVERFYTTKREILGLPELTHVDRYAPLFESKEQVSWERGREIVLESFGAFSEEMRQRAAEFFDRGWIDAEPRKGKSGGAFCSYVTPDLHPYIFQSYLEKMDDVMTLAHELGHGVHASLSRAQSYFNFHGSIPLAELASTFGEMLVFERVTSDASARDKLALYAEKIEGIFATVFRQASMFRFEQRMHEMRRKQGELSAEQIGNVWQEELQAMFGNSVRLGEQHRGWWAYIWHFIGAPFYVYAYSFGELLVLSLYQMAKREGPEFADKYIELLRLGGSRSPQELMATVGVNLNDERFWLGGFEAMERLVSDFEELWAEYRHKV